MLMLLLLPMMLLPLLLLLLLLSLPLLLLVLLPLLLLLLLLLLLTRLLCLARVRLLPGGPAAACRYSCGPHCRLAGSTGPCNRCAGTNLAATSGGGATATP